MDGADYLRNGHNRSLADDNENYERYSTPTGIPMSPVNGLMQFSPMKMDENNNMMAAANGNV